MNYKDVYVKSLNITKEDIVLCEVCQAVAVDIHHIVFKSQGGTDTIDNLIALCRDCHDCSHGKVKDNFISKETLFEITNNRI